MRWMGTPTAVVMRAGALWSSPTVPNLCLKSSYQRWLRREPRWLRSTGASGSHCWWAPCRECGAARGRCGIRCGVPSVLAVARLRALSLCNVACSLLCCVRWGVSVAGAKAFARRQGGICRRTGRWQAILGASLCSSRGLSVTACNDLPSTTSSHTAAAAPAEFIPYQRDGFAILISAVPGQECSAFAQPPCNLLFVAEAALIRGALLSVK
jgi:hypothetical protein